MNRNAIIMAAGMASRFVPLSMETPKALLKVKGEVLIERQINQLKQSGIREIIVVVGYLKEKFEYLKEKYDVILIENPVYQVRNNHSTLYTARNYLGNTFICCGDNYFNENVFQKKTDYSYYAAVYNHGTTKEWCLKTDESNKIIDIKIGGSNSWIMKGHAYFTKDFSQKMLVYLSEAYFDEKCKNKFWEEIYMSHLQEMDMYIEQYEHGIIEEFDSIEELRAFDETYSSCTGSSILKKISKKLGGKEGDLNNIQPIKKQNAIVGFRFTYEKCSYVYLFATDNLNKG